MTSILVTGHTGFKGSWLVVLLHELGFEVSGLSLDIPAGGVFERASLHELMINDLRGDVRKPKDLMQALRIAKPDLVFHLAAQPLVRESYRAPRLTVETNVMGTYNLLEAVSNFGCPKRIVVATTDKVYRNTGQLDGYVEEDPLGGDDIYSSSKAMADILVQSWTKSFPGLAVDVVRGGNVIGGGDVSRDRLLVDLISGFKSGVAAEIRYPNSIRPWQHVLDCLNGYVKVAQSLGGESNVEVWNIGPDKSKLVQVKEVADLAAELWGHGAAWADTSKNNTLHEAANLTLDSSKVRNSMGWSDFLPYPASLEWTIEWERRVFGAEPAREVTLKQVHEFLRLATKNIAK